MIKLNLQYFAKDGPGGEKTEDATQKKLEDARKEGQVAKSKEIANATSLITLFLILKFGLSFIGERFIELFSKCYAIIPEIIKMPDGYISKHRFFQMLVDMLIEILIILAPFLLIGFLVAFLSDYIQVKWKVTAKPLEPKLSKISPLNGIKRLFSFQSIMELIKSFLKLLLIAWVSYTTFQTNKDVIFLLFNMTLFQGVAVAGELAIDFGLKISIIFTLIAFMDWVYQKTKFKKDQKMTKQEVKDEYKQSEGDPQIKGKIRQRMQEASRRRMMQQLPDADVVITNPTHFAVAIKYDSEVASAPIVLAKGEDFLAQKIKEIAKDNKIEIVENKPLARMLYYNVEIGEQVPPELFQAVAEILAMVYSAQGKI